MTDSHLSDVATLRDRARKNVENGAVTEGYDADRQEILRKLVDIQYTRNDLKLPC